MFRLDIFCLVLILCHSGIPQENNKPQSFTFPIQQNEVGCMRYFNKNAIGVDPVNAFYLAKMNELMYPERLDYQFRYLNNESQPLDSMPSTDWLKKHPLIDNSNFLNAFENRFQPYFQSVNKSETVGSTQFYFIEKPVLDTLHFLGLKSIRGYDPEIIVISTNDLVIILFRGTDDVNNNRFAEWIGTDFSIGKMTSDSLLGNANIHKGFWKSFALIKENLITLLEQIDAKSKSIWISGHSLGGAMAIITGVYLEQLHFPVTNVYTYAAPKAIGDKQFAKIAESKLNNKIHRFEYYLDPVSMLWAPGYCPVGKRYWFDNATKGDYTYYPDCGERYLIKRPFEFRKRIFATKENQDKARIKRERMYAFFPSLPVKIFYHNTQWLVKSTYFLVPQEMRTHLPQVEDSFPFIYYGWDQAK